ncbi:MAG: capsular biosynthesis protein, partial [Pyrinomonadaceae bacterium]
FGGDYEKFYWTSGKIEVYEKLINQNFDFVIANDIETLPLAMRLARKETPVILDAHEYSPLEFEDNLRWRVLQKPLIDYICREYIPRVIAATTVCNGIAEMYERNFGKKFEVITNAAKYEELPVLPTNPDKIKLIYHGLAHPSRQTEKQIEMMQFLDQRFELNLMLVGDNNYIENLKKKAVSLTNVKFLPPVPTGEIARFTNQFDIGIFLLPPTNFNYKYALPNKFFEFVQARLAIAVSPSLEMAKLVKEFDLGLVANDFTPRSMATEIGKLTAEKINYFKSQANKHAAQLSAESNREKFLNIVNKYVRNRRHH